MPTAKKMSRPRKSKARKYCSKSKTARSCRSKASCSYSSARSPRCQPKKSRRRSSRKKTPRTPAGGSSSLMTKAQLEMAKKRKECLAGMDPTKFPFECPDKCLFDPKMGMCAPQDSMLHKLLSGKRFLTFKHGKSPAVHISMPITLETLVGDYAGAIRFSPITGKLHLCYGPLYVSEGVKSTPARAAASARTLEMDRAEASYRGVNNTSTRAVLAMILTEEKARSLAKWYAHTGYYAEKRRMMSLHDDDSYYAEMFTLPGASLQLSYQEIVALDSIIKNLDKDLAKGMEAEDKNFGIFGLAAKPKTCPPLLGAKTNADIQVSCFEKEHNPASRMGWFAPIDASPMPSSYVVHPGGIKIPIDVTKHIGSAGAIFNLPFVKPSSKSGTKGALGLATGMGAQDMKIYRSESRYSDEEEEDDEDF